VPLRTSFGLDARLVPFDRGEAGVRTALIPEWLLVDVSWGGHTQSGLNGAGWSVGLAWTPPPVF